MINSAILVMSLTFGQFDSGYICPPTPICIPTDYIYYELDGMTERNRFYEWVEYGERNPIERRVPIINGYVPDVFKRRLETGGWRIVYDYSRRTRLRDCSGYEKEYPKSNSRKQSFPPAFAPEPYFKEKHSDANEYDVIKDSSDSMKSSKIKGSLELKIPPYPLELKTPSQVIN